MMSPAFKPRLRGRFIRQRAGNLDLVLLVQPAKPTPVRGSKNGVRVRCFLSPLRSTQTLSGWPGAGHFLHRDIFPGGVRGVADLDNAVALLHSSFGGGAVRHNIGRFRATAWMESWDSAP